MEDGYIASDLFAYVGDGPPIAPIEEVCWKSSSRWESTSSWLGIQGVYIKG